MLLITTKGTILNCNHAVMFGYEAPSVSVVAVLVGAMDHVLRLAEDVTETEGRECLRAIHSALVTGVRYLDMTEVVALIRKDLREAK